MGSLPGHSRSHLWMLMLQSPCWREDASVLPPNIFQVDPLAKLQPYPCWWESLRNRLCNTLENIERAGNECSLPLNNIQHRRLWWLISCVNWTGRWSDQIFGQCYSRCVSVRVVLGEINICIGRLNKADCAPQCGWASSYQKAPIEQKADPFSE